ncbi:hypothetical protein O1W68_08175 [Rhodococcus sp. H36-A4]|uniref:hypothetical protein n=1 Tax=Rhodococcus sp. H36-A4 TaxID=3004353 RepID=UPI0022AE79D7|nr:hypothetical protein [Rhodococcus sp. H36-A4]MCZ4077912.1 hypothetical protein [Rhodococcus sp. H36-A4]
MTERHGRSSAAALFSLLFVLVASLMGSATAQAAPARFVPAGEISPTVGFDPAGVLQWRLDQVFINQPIFVRVDPALPGLSDFSLNNWCNCAINWFNNTTQVGGVAYPGPLDTGPIRTGSGDVSAWTDIPGGWTIVRGNGHWWVP